MKKSLLRVGVAVSAAALIAGFAGAIGTGHGTARADEPGWHLDLSGLGGLSGLAPAGDWSQPAPAAQPATAPAPQSPIEPAATTGAPAPAPEPASVPQTSPAPATLQLPSTGTGTGTGNGIALLALLAAMIGVACFGAARMVRVESERA